VKSWDHPVKPKLGILVEWRNRPYTGGAPRWEGLVVYAMGAATGWCMQMEWILSDRLMPMVVTLPDGRRLDELPHRNAERPPPRQRGAG